MSANDMLKQLRDIHMPDPVSLWPLTPGWYVLAALVLMLLSLLVYGILQYRKRHQSQRYVLTQLDKLQQQHQAGISEGEVLSELSTLMRRFVLAHYPREKVAHLQGEAWVKFLRQDNPQLSQINHLKDQPYRQQPNCQLDQLIHECRLCLKQLSQRGTNE